MDIRQYLRDEISRLDVTDAREIAADVYARLNADQRAEALEVALPALVREIIQGTRPSAQRALSPTAATAAFLAGHGTGDAHHATAREDHTSTDETVVRPFQPSAKVAGIRAMWRRELDARYADAAGVMRRVGGFSAHDLDALAERCREQSRTNALAAAKWENFARLVRASGVDRLEDLDAAALADNFGGAA